MRHGNAPNGHKKTTTVIRATLSAQGLSTALKDSFRHIIADGGVQNVHKHIVAVEEIFRLQRMEEIKAAETRFLR